MLPPMELELEFLMDDQGSHSAKFFGYSPRQYPLFGFEVTYQVDKEVLYIFHGIPAEKGIGTV